MYMLLPGRCVRYRRTSLALARRAYSTGARPAPTKLNMLVVECYDKAGRERIATVNVQSASDTFASLLHTMTPVRHAMSIDYIQPADSVSHVAEVGELERYDGIVWTGSSYANWGWNPGLALPIPLLTNPGFELSCGQAHHPRRRARGQTPGRARAPLL